MLSSYHDHIAILCACKNVFIEILPLCQLKMIIIIDDVTLPVEPLEK